MSVDGAVVEYPRQFISQVFSSQYTNYCAAASLTVLIADYLQTVDLEVDLIWPTRWNLVKIVYFVNRYLPFVFLPAIIFYNIAPPLSAQACKILFSVPCMGIAFCLLVSEVILYIRVFALSGKTRPIVIFLTLHGGVIIIACLILFAWYLAMGTFAPSPYPEVAGCFGTSSANGIYVLVCFSLILYSGIVTMSLCIWFGLKMYWITRESQLVKIIYRDGTFYFAMLVALSVTNGLVALLAPPRYRFMIAIPQEVMHNVITSRMILHLREQARVEMGFTSISITLDELDILKTDITSSSGLGSLESGEKKEPSEVAPHSHERLEGEDGRAASSGMTDSDVVGTRRGNDHSLV